MFSGLSAFPLTPIHNNQVDVNCYAGLIERLVQANVDSICTLGSTGSYAYLDRQERNLVAKVTTEIATSIPVMVGISAMSTREVLVLAEEAQLSGASAVLLAPMSYQKLTAKEVYQLYKEVTCNLSVPLCVYDNPSTTHFEFSDELHGSIAQLPNVKSIKIPGVPKELDVAKQRVVKLRSLLPEEISIGVSGDGDAATGLNAGCNVWYSVIGGLYPITAKAMTDAAKKGDFNEVLRLSNELSLLWNLFQKSGGSLRVIAAAAELQELVKNPCLPHPLQSIGGCEREQLAELIKRLKLN